MKTNLSKLSFLPLVLLALVAGTSCSTEPEGQRRTAAAFEQGVPGGVVVDTYEVTATVTAVDHEKREATLVTPKGKKVPYKAGPEVTNFDQVRVGDQVRATVTEQLVVYVRDKGEPRTDGQAGLIALAPKGARPGVVMAGTAEITTRVKSVDLKNHKATLEFPDGSTETVQVRPDVKLSATDVGREVVIRATQAVAVRVEKP